jgi:hypothetical protein
VRLVEESLARFASVVEPVTTRLHAS